MPAFWRITLFARKGWESTVGIIIRQFHKTEFSGGGGYPTPRLTVNCYIFSFILIIFFINYSFLHWTFLQMYYCIFLFTACSFGLFGSNCENKCSSNCRGIKSCNHMTGTCDEGCIEGWRGTQCDSGTYL